MPPRCQEIPSAQELLPKFVVLMLAIYYVLYSIHIIDSYRSWMYGKTIQTTRLD